MGRTKEKSREYYLDNIERIKEKVKQYKLKNPDKIKEQNKQYKLKNPDKIKKEKKEYRERNREKIREWNRLYEEKRYNNPVYRLNHNLSKAIRNSLQGKKNGKPWESLINYTQQELRQHLERQFKEGMTWGNYGRNGWHLDHKIPVSLFNIKNVKSKGFKKCWALENLQPLWEKENLKKNNKLFF